MKVKVKLLSHVRLFATPWTVAHQAPLSMGFSRQECWSGLSKTKKRQKFATTNPYSLPLKQTNKNNWN